MNDILQIQNPNYNWKVKIYLLNETGNWDDCGTGNLTLERSLNTQSHIMYEDIIFKIKTIHDDSKIEVSTERLCKLRKSLPDNESTDILLLSCVNNQFIYERQGDSIITWTDSEISEEIALSFLDHLAANQLWYIICEKTGMNPISNGANDIKDIDKFKMPTQYNLEEILDDLENKRDWFISVVTIKKEFFEKMKVVFNLWEENEYKDGLMKIYLIFKELVFAGDVELLELMMNDDNYLLLFGAFEYDPDNLNSQNTKYRNFLTQKINFKEALKIDNQEILRRIHLNYRLSYLRDTVIASYIEDSISNQISVIIYYNNSEILTYILSQEDKLQKFFSGFSQNTKNSIDFLNEVILIGKSLISNDIKQQLCEKLTKYNMYNILTDVLEEILVNKLEYTKNVFYCLVIIDIFNFCVQVKPVYFSECFTGYRDSSKKLFQCFSNILKHCDQGLQIQVGEFLKIIMDPLHDQKGDILNYIYDWLLPDLGKYYNHNLVTDVAKQQFYLFIQCYVDLLIHCVKNHNFRIRQYIITHKILQQLFVAVQMPNKSVQLAVLRLFKYVLKTHDEHLLKHIVANNFLENVFNLFKVQANKHNMINSACLEIFDIIRKDNLKKLVKSFVEDFQAQIKHESLIKYFQPLLLKYEQIHEESQQNNSVNANYTRNNSLTNNHSKISSEDDEIREEEEEYFDSIQEEENNDKEQQDIRINRVEMDSQQEQENEMSVNRLLKIKNEIAHTQNMKDLEEDNLIKHHKNHKKSPTENKHISISFNIEPNSTTTPHLLEKRAADVNLDDIQQTHKHVKVDVQTQEKSF